MDSDGASVVFFAPHLPNTGLVVDEAIPAASAATGAHLILVLLLHILLRPLQLLHPLELPPNLPLIIIVVEVQHGPDEMLNVLDPIQATIGPYPTCRCASPTRPSSGAGPHVGLVLLHKTVESSVGWGFTVSLRVHDLTRRDSSHTPSPHQPWT